MMNIIIMLIIIITNIYAPFFSQAQNRNHSDRSKRSTCSISLRTIFRISSLALLFTSCMFVAIAAAQHVNAVPLGTWANASSLSVARYNLAATSLPNDGLASGAAGYAGAPQLWKCGRAGGGAGGGGGRMLAGCEVCLSCRS